NAICWLKIATSQGAKETGFDTECHRMAYVELGTKTTLAAKQKNLVYLPVSPLPPDRKIRKKKIKKTEDQHRKEAKGDPRTMDLHNIPVRLHQEGPGPRREHLKGESAGDEN
ncbi:hypothetical protein STEG23_016643, partial [Scotinomys teguina]